jgi:hypothetical protein
LHLVHLRHGNNNFYKLLVELINIM